MNVRTKFEALPIPEITGCTPKIWAVPGSARAPFSPKFLMGFYSNGPCEPAKLKSVASLIPEIITIGLLGLGMGVANPQSQGWPI